MKNLIYIAIGGGIAYYLYQRNQKNKKTIAKAPATTTEPVSVNDGNTKTETNDVSDDKKAVADLFLKTQKSLGETGNKESEKLIYKYFDSLNEKDLKDWKTMLNSDAWGDYFRANSFDATKQEKALARKRFAKAMETFKIDVTRFEGLLKSMSLYIQKLVLQSMKEAGFNTENVEILPYDNKSSFNGQISEVNDLIDL